jgi:hypothetical protein
MMGARKPGPQGEYAVSRKTIAQGRPDDPGYTCGDYRVLSTNAHGPRVRWAPGLPCALSLSRVLPCKTRAHSASRARRPLSPAFSSEVDTGSLSKKTRQNKKPEPPFRFNRLQRIVLDLRANVSRVWYCASAEERILNIRMILK